MVSFGLKLNQYVRVLVRNIHQLLVSVPIKQSLYISLMSYVCLIFDTSSGVDKTVARGNFVALRLPAFLISLMADSFPPPLSFGDSFH